VLALKIGPVTRAKLQRYRILLRDWPPCPSKRKLRE